MKLSIIVAASKNLVIGKNNSLPWHLPADLKYFKKVTMGHCIIMGRKTYESLSKPLPGRPNIVITRDSNYGNNNGIIICTSLQEAYDQAKLKGESEAFIIGGAQIINEAIKTVDKIYLTEIDAIIEGDA